MRSPAHNEFVPRLVPMPSPEHGRPPDPLPSLRRILAGLYRKVSTPLSEQRPEGWVFEAEAPRRDPRQVTLMCERDLSRQAVGVVEERHRRTAPGHDEGGLSSEVVLDARARFPEFRFRLRVREGIAGSAGPAASAAGVHPQRVPEP